MADSELKARVEEKANEFEHDHGTPVFLKTCFNALTKLLVTKGVTTEDELLEAFDAEADRMEHKQNKKENRK